MNELFTFDEKKHVYKYDGKPVTGVTTVIGVLAKPALIGWAAKMAVEYVRSNVKYHGAENDEGKGFVIYPQELREVLKDAQSAHTKKKEAAGEHGTNAHALVEEYINQCLLHNEGNPFTIGLESEQIKKVVDWSLENVDHFLFSERKMFNKDWWVAGTADFAYVGKDGKRYMADFKTSSGIYGIDYWLQVAAYRMLAEAEGDEPYDGMTVVRLGKDGKFEVQYMDDYDTCHKAFLSCLTLYRAQGHLKSTTQASR